MKVVIVEDEIVAANRLQKLVKESDPEIKILEVLDSVLDTTNYLCENEIDLLFLDIELTDGVCFEIFEKQQMEVPVIFTTAYDEYMQRAFKVNSIDYLLKPIRKEELNASIHKFKKFGQKPNQAQLLYTLFSEFVENHTYKHRFMVRSGRGYISIDVMDIAYFTSQNKLTYIVVKSGKRYVVDYTLDQLEKTLDPIKFLKINRNYIISNRSVVKVEPFFNNRMLVELNPVTESDVLVNRSYLKNFKTWLDL